MTEDTEQAILEFLKRIEAKLDTVLARLDRLTTALGPLAEPATTAQGAAEGEDASASSEAKPRWSH